MTMSEKRAWYPEWWVKKLAEAQEKERAKAKAKEDVQKQANETQAAPPLDQASCGPGRPPPGGYSLTTGKWS